MTKKVKTNGFVRIVHEAIRQVCCTDNPEQFSRMNVTAYQVAMKTLEIAGRETNSAVLVHPSNLPGSKQGLLIGGKFYAAVPCSTAVDPCEGCAILKAFPELCTDESHPCTSFDITQECETHFVEPQEHE